MTDPRTLVEKIIDAHTIRRFAGRSLLYLDRIVTADTSRSIFHLLEAGGYKVHRPRQVLYIPDHFTPSKGRRLDDVPDPDIRQVIADTEAFSRNAGLRMFPMGDARRGIQHSVSIEQGFALPGLTVAAADSHTLTQGAVGALALSISADMVHALATQTIWLKSPEQMRIELHGRTGRGVSAKDVMLTLLARLGARGAAGKAVEFCGSYVEALGMGGRMTLCNLATELGARAAVVAPDDITFGAVASPSFAPEGDEWKTFQAAATSLRSDADATWSSSVSLDVAEAEPMVSWGTSPADVLPIGGRIPDPQREPDVARRGRMETSLAYMGLTPGTPLRGLAVDQVFIGSCGNAHIEDLQTAATLLERRKVRVPTLVIPGSGAVKAEAEARGLADIFRAAGALWGESGCSLCNAMNGDVVGEGKRCASTGNRNHIGRQGKNARTHVLSPAMAAAAAVTGRLIDVREFPGEP